MTIFIVLLLTVLALSVMSAVVFPNPTRRRRMRGASGDGENLSWIDSAGDTGSDCGDAGGSCD